MDDLGLDDNFNLLGDLDLSLDIKLSRRKRVGFRSRKNLQSIEPFDRGGERASSVRSALILLIAHFAKVRLILEQVSDRVL